MPTSSQPAYAETRIVTDAIRGSDRVSDHLFDGVTNHHDIDPDAYTKMYGPLAGYDPKNPTTLFANARQSGTQMVAPKTRERYSLVSTRSILRSSRFSASLSRGQML